LSWAGKTTDFINQLTKKPLLIIHDLKNSGLLFINISDFRRDWARVNKYTLIIYNPIVLSIVMGQVIKTIKTNK